MTSALAQAEFVRRDVVQQTSEEVRRRYSQYLTPYETARYEASMFDDSLSTPNCLDLGGGTGILSVALATRFPELSNIDVVELDESLAHVCDVELSEHDIPHRVFIEDAIRRDYQGLYDKVILNPPYKNGRQSWKDMQRETRDLNKVPVVLPDGVELSLSVGGQNLLIKSMVEELCPRFAPGGEVLYIDDTNHAEGAINDRALAQLNITIPERGKAPDLIVWMQDKQWLFLMEACSTHGPIDVTRKRELRRLFAGHKGFVVYVSCFPTRKVMQKYLSELAWETEAWCADTADHMIRLDGQKFMGPYRSDE